MNRLQESIKPDLEDVFIKSLIDPAPQEIQHFFRLYESDLRTYFHRYGTERFRKMKEAGDLYFMILGYLLAEEVSKALKTYERNKRLGYTSTLDTRDLEAILKRDIDATLKTKIIPSSIDPPQLLAITPRGEIKISYTDARAA